MSLVRPRDRDRPEALDVLGVSVVPFRSYADAVVSVQRAIDERERAFWVAVNPEKVYGSLADPALAHALRSADVGICDGIGVSVASRLLNRKPIPRCTGCDLFFELMRAASQLRWRVFVLGAKPEVNALACDSLKRQYPGMRIAGRQHGYFTDSAPVIERINDTGVDMLFVALGSPKQEFWICEHRDLLNVPFCMGVGGTLDVVAGEVRRAPRAWRRLGLEFLFRLITEPSRWRRQTVLIPFMLRVLQAAILGTRAGEPARDSHRPAGRAATRSVGHAEPTRRKKAGKPRVCGSADERTVDVGACRPTASLAIASAQAATGGKGADRRAGPLRRNGGSWPT